MTNRKIEYWVIPPDANGVGERIEAFPDNGGQNQRWVFAEPLEAPV